MKKLSSVLAALTLAGGAIFGAAGLPSAATAAGIGTLASTACLQTVTPTTVYFNVNGREFGMCYDGTTLNPGNNPVVRIKTGARSAKATFSGIGTVTIPANTSQNFGNLTLTKLVVG